MHQDGFARIDGRRHGLFSFLRKKQWWSFEGLDPGKGVHFVFLAMQAFPVDYMSVTVLDYKHDKKVSSERICSVQAEPGEQVSVAVEGKKAHLHFSEGGNGARLIEVLSPEVTARLNQEKAVPPHFNRLLTKRIDYNILQYLQGDTQGMLCFDGVEQQFDGYGYFEHCWGVQPRHSAANWLHFWCPDAAGVLLDCRYDAGTHHHYNYLLHDGQGAYLSSPAYFHFDPDKPDSNWRIVSPDLDLLVTPLTFHRNRKRIPPLLAYIDIDYYELLVEVRGWAHVQGERIMIDGIGKYDHNFNKW